jgi:catechol 2,3-dioxygenase-like lactoylglutathione lyase family enzyme
MQKLDELKLHHIGCVVANIERSKMLYRDMMGFSRVGETILVAAEKVAVCFIEIGNGVFLELIESRDPNSPVANLLDQDITYYHLAYAVDNIQHAIETLSRNHCKLRGQFASEAFQHHQCAFMFSPEGHLFELIELPEKS